MLDSFNENNYNRKFGFVKSGSECAYIWREVSSGSFSERAKKNY